MKLFKHTLLALVCAGTMSAQAQNVENEVDQEASYLSSKTVPVFKGYKNTNGSIYNDKEFKRGTVFVDGKMTASNVGLRYNAQSEEIEYMKQLGSQATVVNVVKKSENIDVKILNDHYVYLPSPGKKFKDGYLIVLEENDKLTLYKKLSKEFVEGKKSVNSYTRDVPDSFKEREVLFIKVKGEEIKEVPGSKGKRKKLFSSKENEVATYMKNEKLNLRKDEDLIKALKYYSTLN
ncbi:hypothetical protein [Patiriisocius marinus]|uniref:hypothetical protein n=1 Tax=Patiriisocius marinus TaxID=1397112 RepID=UPI00232BB046|nr:hypothetical protein [Patiriisocius marinus]